MAITFVKNIFEKSIEVIWNDFAS